MQVMTLAFRPTRNNLPVQPAQVGLKNSQNLESEKVKERCQILAMFQIITLSDFFKIFSEGCSAILCKYLSRF